LEKERADFWKGLFLNQISRILKCTSQKQHWNERERRLLVTLFSKMNFQDFGFKHTLPLLIPRVIFLVAIQFPLDLINPKQLNYQNYDVV
jgi:hypothetical protein